MKTFFSAIGICLVLSAPAQTDSAFIFGKQYGANVVDFTVDNLGNLYLLFQNGQLKKLRSDGDSLAVFNNVRKFGKAFSLDVSNPLKVLLYYKDFGTIVILDRLLNERSVIDLRRQNLLQVKTIGQSYDNNIWVFDALEVKVKKIGDDGRTIDQFTDFRLIFDSTPSPQKIVDADKYVYLYDPAMGVYIFDYYGGFKNRIPFRGWKDFAVINGSLLGRDDHFIYRYDAGSLQLQQLPVPLFMQGAQKMIIATDKMYILKDGTIMVYSYRPGANFPNPS